MNDSRATFRITPRLVLGLGVMAAGLLLTLDQLDLYDAEIVFDYWPLLLVAIGATRIAGRHLSDKIFAASWIVIGLWLLAWNLDFTDLSPFELFWPLVLILCGLTLIFGARRRALSTAEAEDAVNIVAVMGGVDRQNSSARFDGGDVTVCMGGGELDLRQAVLEDDAVIQVFALWGGYGFRVPPDWNVSMEVVALLGSLEDHRSHHERREGAPTLTLKGVVIMGGLEVKN